MCDARQLLVVDDTLIVVQTTEATVSSVDEVRRWRRRPVLGALIRFAGFVVPFCAASAAVAVVGAIYGPPAGGLRLRLRPCSGSAVLLGDRDGRRRSSRERVVRPLFPLALAPADVAAVPGPGPVAAAHGAASRGHAARPGPARRPGGGDRRAGGGARGSCVLVSALGRHDRITRGHCERVRTYADLMATRLGALRPRRRPPALGGAAARHRQAAGGLRHAEQEGEARRRRVGGDQAAPDRRAALIAPMAEWLGSWADAVPQHHERVDGTGLPEGPGRRRHPPGRARSSPSSTPSTS